MQNAFGIPYAPLHNAFRVSAIDEIYGAIENTFGISFDGEFNKWRDKAIELEERAHRELNGLKYAMMPGVDMPAVMAAYFAGFGMEPVIMHILDLHSEDIVYAKKLKESGYDPPVCRIVHIDNDIEIIQNMQPDISFGWKPDTAADSFKCVEDMGDFFGVTGYERTVGLLYRIFTILETGKQGERMDLYGSAPF
jgi:nitrogenase molybdenum-iron protein alpha/beta subunit